jgi:hypothetical protein
VSAPVDSDPLTAFAPVHAPEAVQAFALVELHVSVAPLPDVTVVGVAVSVKVGAIGVAGGVAGESPPLEHAATTAATTIGDNVRSDRERRSIVRACVVGSDMDRIRSPWLGDAL